MGQQQFVVKYNETTDTYLTGWVGEFVYANCSWGLLENAITYPTLADAQAAAAAIGGGTVGVPR